MQKRFTKEYMFENCGCYDENNYRELKACSFMQGGGPITIQGIINSEIPLKDKFWFVTKKTGLTTQQKQQIAVDVAEIVLPIYEEKYPYNNRVRECIDATKQYLTGHIPLEKLIENRRAAAAAAAAADAAADAAAAAAYAAYAAYAAAAYAADAAAAYAAYAANAPVFKEKLLRYLQQIPEKY